MQKVGGVLNISAWTVTHTACTAR